MKDCIQYTVFRIHSNTVMRTNFDSYIDAYKYYFSREVEKPEGLKYLVFVGYSPTEGVIIINQQKYLTT